MAVNYLGTETVWCVILENAAQTPSKRCGSLYAIHIPAVVIR